MQTKKVRLYINGVRQKDIRPNMTKWQIFIYKVKVFLKVLFWGLVGMGIFIGIYELGAITKPIVVYKDKEVILDNLVEKKNELQGELVKSIQNCERAGYNEDDGIIIFDSNKQASIGTYQFQKKTVIYYYKTLYGKDIKGKEAVMIALDDEKAGELASRIIFETEDGLSNWYNCSKKVGAYEQLKLIKKL